ncbi:hypothetical protein THAOC_06690 [Thalassiosira oceanica]|uniref:Thioredoxin domain-containing protein n=1 Tax=Thalassiosira oceanica TaxID=159749 RepID=K0T227_THAOC|nr:hypothetical protein THAOC_06690 [Thalassiosira oceanica]|eukprot:EJK71830.1 hypothetical protein THAOC_06690 [Thalassiosira oceanica]
MHSVVASILLLCCVCAEGFHSGASPTGNIKRKLSKLSASSDDSDVEAASISSSPTSNNDPSKVQFGDSVPFVPRASAESDGYGLFEFSDDAETLKQNRMRNIAVAVASFSVAIFNYGWQLSHPVSAISILASMQSSSQSIETIGNNGKPTVIDFWAPWCENCKVAAPTLQAVEKDYGDRVNFIMVNADEGRNWPLIQLFGVDAIPHLALLSGEGDVETALIGPTSRTVLKADIDALLNKKADCDAAVAEAKQPVCHDDLPYKMYDAFGRRNGRRVNFVDRQGW